MKRIPDSPWFPFGLGSMEAGMRIFCLPYAGGGAAAYLPLRKAVPARVSIVPVQLPGRETRLGEPIPGRLTELVDMLADALIPALDRPYSLFGYSMGAKLAFALIHVLEQRGGRMPERLGVAANTAPDAGPHRAGVAKLPDAEFRDYLRQLGGTPEQVLGDPDLARLLFPILRADFHLLEQSTPLSAVQIPIVAYAGLEDGAAPAAAMQRWRLFTRGSFVLRVFPGGHFFMQSAAADFGATLVGDLCREETSAVSAHTALA